MPSITLQNFEESLGDAQPPAGIGPALEALWREAKGDWDGAHALAQAQEDATGAWIHAYLHRVEGDLANAGYWYRRAGQPVCEAPLRDEWSALARTLLAG